MEAWSDTWRKTLRVVDGLAVDMITPTSVQASDGLLTIGVRWEDLEAAAASTFGDRLPDPVRRVRQAESGLRWRESATFQAAMGDTTITVTSSHPVTVEVVS